MTFLTKAKYRYVLLLPALVLLSLWQHQALVMNEPQTAHKTDSQLLLGRGGALVKSMTLNWRVVGSTPGLAAT